MTESKMIKKGDFVELDYTGRTKEENIVFDTTLASEAVKAGMDDEKAEYSPMIICIGEKQVVPGLDDYLVGKDSEKEYEVALSPEKAFGKKDPSMLQLIPTARFRQDKIIPAPGMQ